MRKSMMLLAVLPLVMTTSSAATEYFTKDKTDKRIGQPTDDEALVYFVRTAKTGRAIKTWAFVDDQSVGVSKPCAYLFTLVPEGAHVFWSRAENVSAFEMEVEGGQTYYLKMGIRPGVIKARTKLVPIDEEEGKKALEKCGHVELTEEGRKRGAEIAGQAWSTAKEEAARKKAKAGN